MVDGPAETFSHDRAHTSANKCKIHTGNHHIFFVKLSYANSARIRQPCFFLSLLKPVGILFTVHKFQWIFWEHFLSNLRKLSIIKKNSEILFTTNSEMVTAQRINPKVFLQLPSMYSFSGCWDFNPNSFGHVFLFIGLYVGIFSFKPRHKYPF